MPNSAPVCLKPVQAKVKKYSYSLENSKHFVNFTDFCIIFTKF